MKKYILTEDDIKMLRNNARIATALTIERLPSYKSNCEDVLAGYLICLKILDMYEVEDDDNSNHRKN